MQILRGYTRIVILAGPYAIKIARIRPLKTVFGVVKNLMRRFVWSSDDFQVHLKKFRCHPVMALWIHTFIGIYANRAEHAYWQQTNDVRCVPIKRGFLWGLVIFQGKAEPVSEGDILASPLAELYRTDSELCRPEQYGRYGGQCRVIDYAQWGGFDFGQQQ